MSKLPFSVYDTFAYLASGFIVAFGADLAFGLGLREGELGAVDALAGVVLLYIAGHLVAHLSSALFESVVVQRWLGPPEKRLLNSQAKRPAASIFRAYFRPLPPPTRERLTALAGFLCVPPGGRAFFYECHGVAQRDPVTRERLASFLNLYGFCRNASLALLLSAALLIVGALLTPGAAAATLESARKLAFALAALVGSFGLFVRYLKFFRHYTTEVFLCYLASDSSKRPLSSQRAPVGRDAAREHTGEEEKQYDEEGR